MNFSDIELPPLEPTDDQKRQFRLAVIASNGRQCLDPGLKVYVDEGGYGAIVKSNSVSEDGERVTEEKCFYLGTDGKLSVEFDVESINAGLARAIKNDIFLRERKEAIAEYCAETGLTPWDAEQVITEHLLSRLDGEHGDEVIGLLLNAIDRASDPDDTSPPIDPFEFEDLIRRIIRNHVAL